MATNAEGGADGAQAPKLAKENLNYLFHHIFLPPKLPGGQDSSGEKEELLIDFVLDSLRLFLFQAHPDHTAAAKAAICMAENMKDARDALGRLQESGTQSALNQISSNEALASFHITAQNAGVVIHKVATSVILEVFELSPTNSSVHSTRGRLQRQFPASAIAVPSDLFDNEDFRSVLGKTLVKMSHQPVEEMQLKVKKAQQIHNEERDTIDPRLVTELLVSFLRGCGKQVHVRGICKNTREDVMWNQSKLPWRRSPVWLLLRVSLQLTMNRVATDSGDAYKSFMVFFLSRILEANVQQSPGHVLHTMRTKISRRLLKLENPKEGAWLGTVRDTLSRTSHWLEDQWQRLCVDLQPPLDLTAVSRLKMNEDVFFDLCNMDQFISSILHHDNTNQLSRSIPTSQLQVFRALSLPQIPSIKQDYLPFRLAMVESWVAANLESWVERHVRDETTCLELSRLIRDYHASAISWYANRPEGASRMHLVILELWIAADKAALHAFPILQHYEPEIPFEVYQALLLSLQGDMARLARTEAYLHQRQRFAEAQKRPSVFSSFGHPDSLPVRYFSESMEQQALKKSIERQATAEREAKRQEFRKLKAEYNRLMRLSTETVCEMIEDVDVDGLQCNRHDPNCTGCRYKAKANSLCINIHEWPLPSNDLEAKTTVFELSLPPGFAEWRDLTVYLIDDVLRSERPPSSSPHYCYPLQTYQGLSKYHQHSTKRRIHLLSATKPNVVTHRRAKSISCSSESDVCVNNGLRFKYFDGKRDVFVTRLSPSLALSDLCRFQLPGRSDALKCFLVRNHVCPDGESPNEVIASQSSCPDHLSLGEYKALASSAFGYRIVWKSILTQLAMPSVDFNKTETATFMLQLCLQAGPNSAEDINRSTHAILSDTEFGHSMLTCLRTSVSRIQENWESYVALWTFSFLAARLLSMTTQDLKPQYLQLLKYCREVSYRWISQLHDRIRNTTDSSQKTEFLRVLVDISLVCADSFNLDQQYLEEVLSEPQQASILVEVSIIVQNNANLGNMEKGVLQTTTRGRWQHTLHRSCLFLTEDVISNGNACLSLAVTRCWPPFNSGGGWHLAPSNWYWFETIFAQLEVRLNILTGELLVNGLPLSRLPWSYSNHPHYLRLFERLALDVMPSPIHGMHFSSTETFAGYKVHFSMQPAPWDSSYHNLLIRLENDGVFHDLIPHQVLDGKLPDSLVEDFVHWYHHDTSTIEFRPLGSPWKTDSENWCLRSDGTRWKLTQGDHISLIAPTSNSGQLVTSIFAALESPLRLHMLFNEKQDSLEVKLHHLQLNFDLRFGDTAIRSRQFRDMQIDADQSIGTLVGFKSKLVLRNGQDSQVRVILIPEGALEYRKSCRDGFDDHVEVSMICDTARQVHSYSIDHQLDRLVDNDTIQSKLYLAYLHGITSYCLPDPLLGRTGTEQALSILGSASVRSVACLNQKNMQLLDKIAHLSPGRSFYPPHERVMQVVKWSSHLTFVTQDDRFYKVISNILEKTRTIEFLYPSSSIEADDLTHANMHLVTRQIIRGASRHVSGFGAEDFTLQYDRGYESRDRGYPSARATRASKTAYMIYHDHQFLQKTPAPDLAHNLYRLLSAGGTTQSFRVPPTPREMEYDSKWLQEPSYFLSKDWCRLHFAFQTNRQWLNKFQLMIWLATMSYATKHVPQVTQALLALSFSSRLSAVSLPSGRSFDLFRGYQAQSNELGGPIRDAATPFQQSHESDKAAKARRKRERKAKKKREIGRFCDQLMQQWPCPTPQQPTGSQMGIYINGAAAMNKIQPMWSTWHENLLFKEYIEKFVDVLKTIPKGTFAIPSFPRRATLPPTTRLPGFVSIHTLFTNPAPSKTPVLHQLPSTLIGNSTPRTGSHKLLDVLALLDLSAKFDNERQYLAELRSSLSQLRDAPTLGQVANRGTLFQWYLEQCEIHVKSVYQSLSQAIGAVSGEPKQSPASSELKAVIREIVFQAKFWPRVSPILFLQQLTNSRWCHLSGEWKDSIVAYGEAIAALQQAKRLVQFQHHEVDLLKELENLGPRGWDPREYPEWLLLECESGIMIREAQQQIARQMMNPPDGRNAMMQLNMGEGKSTVIAPIVAAALSDGSTLVRVIVAKPQAKQMFHFLVSKLSGLLDRPVYQFPFSRAIRMDPGKVDALRQLVTKCMEEGGILLVQPEHLLSFQLMGLEYQIDGATEVAGKLLEMQRFFDKSSRDVVDESDENFSVKFELVYTHGQQRPMEHSPERWVVIQEVLGLFAKFANEIKKKFPESVDLDDRYSERVPRIRVLRPDAEHLLLSRLASHICDKGITGLPLARQPFSTRVAVQRYILEPVPSPEDIAAVEDSPFWAETIVHNILLLRGLLAGGILAFVFGLKRWRVNYGTDTKREKKTRLVVPFRAKDSPTPRSEFSHPDVVIVLTCLSYYYSGLEDEDLFDALNLLTRSDNADLEYQAWVVTAPSLPLAFKQLNGINLRDPVQCTSEVFQHLRYSKRAIDYFLSHMVFAKELKEFPHKLTASGWDLGKVKQNPTTGFSGTNDSRYVLPLDVEQLDLPEQKHTNSLVLEYLLRSENGTALMPPRGEGANSDCEALLGMVTKMGSNTRVILDVGAQVIDLNNRDFAEAWLKMYEGDPTTQAVVFFSDADELMVLDHSGKVEVLQTSPFAKLLDQCLIFLDEAHTRGTDLKLPEFYRAAVTLGANLTKDRLVQACMRMRKLGKGQSVVFCVPREIERKISRQRETWSSSQPPVPAGDLGTWGLDALRSWIGGLWVSWWRRGGLPQSLLRRLESRVCSRRLVSEETERLTVSDVVCWAISETWTDLRRTIPLWVTQGLRFYQQDRIWEQFQLPQGDQTQRVEWARRFLEEEAQSLDQRYRPRTTRQNVSTIMDQVAPTIGERFQHQCHQFGITEFGTASLQEEQERELSPETEQERQVEKPPRVKAADHEINSGLRDFIKHGELPDDRKGFKPAFMALSNTTAAKHLDVAEFPSHVWVTDDFARTIQTISLETDCSDSFQRPVQWVLTSASPGDSVVRHIVIISPYEANELLPNIQASRFVTLHLYSPRINLGFQPLDHLGLYTVPQRAPKHEISCEQRIQLNLFAGQLYLSSFQEYAKVCDALGLASSLTEGLVILEADGFIPPDLKEGKVTNQSGFTKSPVKFMKVLMSGIRQNCEAIEKTCMGKILDGVLLAEEDFVEG